MTRLAVTVEGPTERGFVTQALAPHLHTSEVYAYPILLGQARANRRGGGNVSVQGVASDMADHYHRFDFVTSLVDLYGFRRSGGNSAEYLEEQIFGEVVRLVGRGVDSRKVIPYVQQYEFEGLLFSDLEALGNTLEAARQAVEQLANIRAQFRTPEEINDNLDTAPSKRLAQILPYYNKVRFGPLVAQEIGLSTIRRECPRFNAWVTRLESLGD